LRRLGFSWPAGQLQGAEGEFFATSLLDRLLPAIGQGAIALQNRVGDAQTAKYLEAINHRETWLGVRAERELQRLLEGDCSLPVGARSVVRTESIEMSAILFGEPGEPPRQASHRGPASGPESVATGLFAKLCPKKSCA
jgi:hydroxymethylbilane synthase